MTISKEQLIARKEQIKKDFDVLVTQIEEQENKIKSMNFLSQSRTRKLDINTTKDNYRKDNDNTKTITRRTVRPQHI